MASKIFLLKCLHRVRFFGVRNSLFFQIYKAFGKVEHLSCENVERAKKIFSILSTTLGLFFFPIEESINRLFPVVAAQVPDSGGVGSLRKRFNFIADIVEQTAKAVVLIEVKNVRFFAVLPSNGSGFIVEENGLILTNAHVVMNKANSTVTVKLVDGRTFQGTVEDVDLTSDLATIRIEANNLPVLKLGSSKDLRPGEWVVAIGSPLSLSNTITTGVISSPSRQGIELGVKNREMDYIQTDASITFGNSGGPLVNLDGEAIGINCMKITGGISFAIPVDYAKDFLKKSQQKRRSTTLHSIQAKYTGITMITLTPGILQELCEGDYNIPSPNPVLVGKVVVGSPGETGGLKVGDIVTHVNSYIVEGTYDVYKALETGQPLRLRVLRDGVFLDLTVVPEEN